MTLSGILLSPPRPEPPSRAILGALSRHVYLTAGHLVDLGVVPSRRSAQAHMTRLSRSPGSAWLAVYRPGAQLGKIPYVYALTPAGAEAAQEVVGYLPRVVKLPISFDHDYWHRITFLDAQIALERWAERAGVRLVASAAYFHPGGSRGVAVTAVAVPGDRKARLVPDGVFTLRCLDGRDRLVTLEVWMGLKTWEVLDRAVRYCFALHSSRRCIEAAFLDTVRGSARVLFVFETEAGMRAALARCGEVIGWEAFAGQFFCKTIASFRADPFDGWTEPVTGATKPLYRLA